jgi:acyltransferase
MIKQRVLWVDNAKAIGIILVLLGHQAMPYNITKFIYSFHMPLFFFLSGFINTGRDEESFSRFAVRKAKSLLIPYFFFAIATYLYWLLITRNFGFSSETHINALTPLLGILYSNGVDDWLTFNTSLWFLTCLYLTEMAFFIIRKIRNDALVVAILMLCMAAGYIQSVSRIPRLPWGANVALMGIALYGIGNLVRAVPFEGIKKKNLLPCIPVFLLLNIASILFNVKVDMDYNVYGNCFQFLSGAISGIILMICVSNLIARNLVFDYIAKNTLIIMALHLPMSGVVNFVIKKAFHDLTPPTDIMLSILYNILFSIVTLLLIFPIAALLDRRFPYLIGRKARFDSLGSKRSQAME